jgi:hypothetical protein
VKEILPGEKWFFASGRWQMGWHAQAEKRAAQKLLGVTDRRGYFVVGDGP